ncbi:MAG: hypothetical protein GY749_07495 [Desulfobacteraceae bacterium]|nr:hypothetical protein [Desulfobacteraceae bacterium]
MTEPVLLYLRWLIAIIFRYAKVIIPKAIVSICSNDYDMPKFQYDDADVLLQMMFKTPVAIS